MKVFLVLLFGAAIVWPLVSWATYHISGWSAYQKKYRRDVTHDTFVASSLSLKKF